MVRKIGIGVVVVLLLQGCGESELKQANKKEIQDLGFRALYPPRENFGPGLVFRLVATEEKQSLKIPTKEKRPQISVVCKALLTSPTLIESKAALPKSTIFDKKTFGLGLGVASGLIGDVRSAEASLANEKAKTLTVSFEDGQIQELPEEERVKPNGTKSPIVPSCADILTEYKVTNKFQSLFIVYSALLARKSSIKIDFDGGTSAKVDLNIRNLLTIKPEVKTTKKGNSEIQFETPLYLGYNAMALTDFVLSAAAGPEAGVVYGRPLSADESQMLSRAE